MHDLIEPVPLSVGQVCYAAGCSYRQLDYWCRIGLVDAPGSGSGTHRRLTARHALELAVIVQCAALGVVPRLVPVDQLLTAGIAACGPVAITLDTGALVADVTQRIKEST